MAAEPGLVARLVLLKQGGATACEIAEALRETRNTLARDTDRPGDACGYRDATAAFTKAADAWFDELTVYIRVLEDICAGLQKSAGALGGQDQQSAADISSLV